MLTSSFATTLRHLPYNVRLTKSLSDFIFKFCFDYFKMDFLYLQCVSEHVQILKKGGHASWHVQCLSERVQCAGEMSVTLFFLAYN